MKCPQCGQDNAPSQKHCGECGARLALRCGSCGASNPSGQKFCGECSAGLSAGPTPSPATYTPKHLAERILTSKAAVEGEPKQVTVLFADLKGSMELLADRDPEEARKILDPVLEKMMEVVHRYEGTVNQVMGDGIMALFGAPLAHEDHAVRACYAALRMQESVKKYAEGVWRSEGVRIQIRVGLNSGEVVVRSIGSDLHMDYTAVGQTTHLAARMEQMADPGMILLTPDTLHLAEGFVRVQSLGMVAVKGLATPSEIFELTGASPVRSRLQAAAARGLTTFVGRHAEMDTLFTALEQAKAGRGQVGEPGVGKSRLYWEFTHSHRTQGWLIVESSSVSYGRATAFLPVIELLRTYFQIEAHDDPRKIRERSPASCCPWIEHSSPRCRPSCGSLIPPPTMQSGSTRRSAATGRWTASNGCSCGRARDNSFSSCSRISTGSIPRPRRSSTAWWRACRQHACCCWSPTGRSISTGGRAKPTTGSFGSTPCRPRAPASCLMRSSAMILGLSPSNTC